MAKNWEDQYVSLRRREIGAWKGRVETMEHAARRMAREIDALRAFEDEIVEVIGRANWRALRSAREGYSG